MSAWTSEQIFIPYRKWKIPCEQFMNFFILYFYEGGGKLEKSHALGCSRSQIESETQPNFY